jgi:hypothetical protein
MSAPDEIERVFAPIAGAVDEFAREHSLVLDKCVRGNVGWELTFPHNEGGTAFLLLLHDPSLGLGVGSVWQFPCPEMSRRYVHFREMRACELQPEPVTKRLEEELGEITKVRFGFWTHIEPI